MYSKESGLFSTAPKQQDRMSIYLSEFLQKFSRLDKAEFQSGSDGRACWIKFSNMSGGLAKEKVEFFNDISTQILEDRFVPSDESRLDLIDLLVIYANHIDQHTKGAVNPLLPIEEKEKLVLSFLKAAKKLFSSLVSDSYDFKDVDPRILSSLVLFLVYYGKALRYDKVPDAERLKPLNLALEIAQYLETLNLTEAQHPHKFDALIDTINAVRSYPLEAEGFYDEAAATVIPNTLSANITSKAQAHARLAEIYLKKQNAEGQGIEDALQHSREGMSLLLDLSPQNPLMAFNVRVAHMKGFYLNGQLKDLVESRKEAVKLAMDIRQEYEENPNCGAKEHHLKDANIILAKEEELVKELIEERERACSLRP